MPRRPSIVVIDDSDTTLSVLARHVAELGYQAVTSTGVRHALSNGITDEVAFILIDLIMPDMDGYEGIVAIRQIAPSVPIIAMSAGDASRGRYDMLREARRSGADAVIEKPFGPDMLKETLDLAKDRAACEGPSVVVLDDSRTICSAVTTMLKGLSYDVHAFTEPEDVLNSHRVLNVDVLLTDIFMPGKSGIDVIRECHDAWPDLRVVAMSAGFKDMPLEKALKAAATVGAVDVIGKPFTADEIDTVLKRAIATREAAG